MTKSLGARLLSELNAAHGRPDTLVRRAPQHGNPAMELKDRRVLEKIYESP
jgi:hypothetical protein